MQNISYHYENNKVYGLLGPNGAGKSTFFKAILNVINYSGNISLPSHHIGQLVEAPAFYANLSCFQNLKLHSNYLNFACDIDNYLSIVHLQDAKYKKFKDLSMGMKQRLGIAKTLIGNSNLILLDEPTNGLDPSGIKDIRNIILEKVKSDDRTSIISSHILQEVATFTDVFIFIKGGQLVTHLKNTSNYYSILELDKMTDAENTFNNHEYSIVKFNSLYYIVGDYKWLKNYDSSITKMTIEDIYLWLMEHKIEEAYLK
ncbi:ATP-binding cassette domain-containing protein [Staphylococcus croceilyticus]|uniref:ATP-binding cassette domain-containing protein n=1 Tax=Staphylococcus croceilyticus TaxID=319942 RepID=UPI001432B461|nr:ATP-binding cassette domain-containing protein [Staphylococcus croceilyticus]